MRFILMAFVASENLESFHLWVQWLPGPSVANGVVMELMVESICVVTAAMAVVVVMMM